MRVAIARSLTYRQLFRPLLTKQRRGEMAGLMLLCLCSISFAHAQQRNNSGSSTTGLAQQNLSQVSASAKEIKIVLARDPGLLVELKRWVAKDATDHGQVVGSEELSDYAILDRLESDVEFRSIATILLQKYGYLLPKLNPESDLAKEQELLRVERAKWLAQSQEEERSLARQKEASDLQRAQACQAQPDRSCNQTQPSTSPAAIQAPGQPQQIQAPLPENPPDQDFTIPGGGTGNTPQRQQLLQTSNSESSGSFSQLSTGNSSGIASLGDENGAGGPSSQTDTNINRQIASGFATGSQRTGNSSDGLLAAYGMGTGGGSGFDLSSMPLPEGLPTGSVSPSAGASPLVPMQPNRRSPERAAFQPPDMVRRLSPYEDVPSLYDMYMQTVTRPASPQRFGSEVFENGTRDLQLIPMDLPAGPDYVIGPGDGLSIDLWGGISQRLTRTVDRGGQISLPEVGPVLVSGKSLAAVQQDLQQILRTQFRDVSAGVSLSRLRTIRIYEVGDVNNAGAYDISSLSTPLNALFVAGGPSPRGSLRIVNHYRDGQLVQSVDMYDLLLHGVKTNIERLENGDTVQVPPIGPQVTIEGMIRRPAIYELRDEKTLASVLELAGGLLPTASLRHIEVQRLVAHEKQTMLSLDIPDSDDKAEVTKKLEAFDIQDGDRIRIYPIAPYNQDTIYVDGHVVRPGRYSYKPDMRVTDVISSFKDVLPEPADQYAEIIRLNPPDFRPSVESFNLASALADPSKAPLLHPMDTVRIFSRFDFENAPSVAVLGDVRIPGDYKTTGQIRLADAIHLAGGLSPDAQTSDAQVFRYLPDGKFKIFSVSLSGALAGDPVENIILESRDRLLVHKNPDAIEGATVYVEGEVGKPGRYPLTTNMHVADLIRIGGGLKPSADTQLANLTKYEWSDNAKLAGQQQEITISAALAGDANANVPVHNGDVLTIRQLPGWNDLGASISVKGEVKNPGVYGIRPGERLSSVLVRAGGFRPDAYLYGAVLERVQVRDLEMKQQESLILRAKGMENNIQLMPENDANQKRAKEAAMLQYQETLEDLTSSPPLGRVTVRVSSTIDRWKGTAADIEVRAGDTLIIPKKPSFVLVQGQVFNPTAVAYRPGKTADWYLTQSGGPTMLGNKKSAFVIRADGSVVGAKRSLWGGEEISAVLLPGDSVVVPEKPIGGPIQWQNLFATAQVASSIASTIFIALRLP